MFINLIFFQSVWFLAVLGAAGGHQWWGLAGLAAFIVVHYFASATAKPDFLLALFATVFGLFIETLIQQTGLLIYKGALPSMPLAPVWILVLWANFALTMNGCIRWLQEKPLLAAILGAIGGPLSYFGGIKLGAATAGHSMPVVLIVIAIIYALMTPLFLEVARRLPHRLKRAPA